MVEDEQLQALGFTLQSDVQMAIPAPVKNGVKSPTCRVCGDESSGFHYGVDSCEGCKGFFRRCITQGMTHKCSNEEKCEITPFTRNSCQYCRLKKCFAVGMSREASRLGRRPKRLKDTSGEKVTVNLPIAPYPSPAELYKLRMAELQRLLQQNGTFKSELMQAFLSAAQASFREHQKQPQNANKQVGSPPAGSMGTTLTHESGYSSLSSPASSKSQSPIHELNANVGMVPPSVSTTTTNIIDNTQFIEQSSPRDNNNQLDNGQYGYGQPSVQVKTEPGMTTTDLSNLPQSATPTIQLQDPFVDPFMMGQQSTGAEPFLPDPNANLEDLERLLEEVCQVPTETRKALIDQVTETVIDAHFQTCKPTHQAVNEANQRMEQMRLQNILPDFSKLSIDASSMWQQFLENMVPEITLVVKFCKKLPGFAEISQEDQIKLIKQGAFEVLMCRFCMLVDIEKNQMFDPDMKMKCPRDVVKSMPMGGFLDEFFPVAEMFNPLKLTDGEIGLFTASLMICPERKDLVNVRAVSKLQQLFQQAFYFLLRKNHSDHENLFVRVMTTIPVFRQINAEHSMALNNIKMSMPHCSKDFPALQKEVWDL